MVDIIQILKSRKLKLRKVSGFRVSHLVSGGPKQQTKVLHISKTLAFLWVRLTSLELQVHSIFFLSGEMGLKPGWNYHDLESLFGLNGEEW